MSMTLLTMFAFFAIFFLLFWVVALYIKMDKLKDIIEYRKSDNKASTEDLNKEKAEAKKEGKQKILNLIGEKGKIKNNDVENLLKVSDATATRYLNELEKEGKVKQVGKEGAGVYYEKNGSHGV